MTRFKPSDGERFWFVDSDLKVHSGIYEFQYHNSDRWVMDLWKVGNVFRTKAQARRAQRRFKQVIREVHEELGE